MTQPTNMNKFRKAKAQDKAKGKTLCSSGFHKWQDDEKKQFDIYKNNNKNKRNKTSFGITLQLQDLQLKD